MTARAAVLCAALAARSFCADPPSVSPAQQLCRAAGRGDLQQVTALLASGVLPDTRCRDGATPLIWAASNLRRDQSDYTRVAQPDHVAVAQLLLDKGADINARDKQGASALMAAAVIEWDERANKLMWLLLAKGANPNSRDQQGHTAADHAAEAGYIERAKFLIEHGTQVGDVATFLREARNFALVRDIASGDPEHAKAMLREGADPNVRNRAGRTVLMIAADNRYSAIKVNLLLAEGARVNASNRGETAVMIAADQYVAETVAALLDKGADPNAVDRNGNTVLLHAAASKNSYQEDKVPLIHLLLYKGANPAPQNLKGQTALMLLAGSGSKAVPLLLAKPLNVNARDREGNTALLYAARTFSRSDQWHAAEALLNHGADVNAANKKGETALMLAANQSEPNGILLLLERGANVNAVDKKGNTALRIATRGGFTKVAEVLRSR